MLYLQDAHSSEHREEKSSEAHSSEKSSTRRELDNSSTGVKDLTGMGKDEVGIVTFSNFFPLKGRKKDFSGLLMELNHELNWDWGVGRVVEKSTLPMDNAIPPLALSIRRRRRTVVPTTAGISF